jgi:hypothetical protein
MIKRLNKFSLVIIILVPIELFLFIGAYLFHRFTISKMGMYRHVIYLNRKYEAVVPFDVLKYLLLSILSVSLLVCLINFIRLQKKKIYQISALILTIVINWYCLTYLLTNTTGNYRDYYYVGLLLGLGAILNNIIAGLTFSMGRLDKNIPLG